MAANRRDIADVDRLIHEPARLLIIIVLHAVEEADFTYLMGETGLTKGNLSSHLSKLEEAGYVNIEKTYKGKVPLTVCRMTDTGRHAFAAYRETLQRTVLGSAGSGASQRGGGPA